MKVRVIKEMPLAKVGTLIPINKDGFAKDHGGWCVSYLRKEGWVEEVKEESLEDKLRNGISRLGVGATPPEVAQIAKDHYLEVFDNFIRKHTISGETVYKGFINPFKVDNLRKALEEA